MCHTCTVIPVCDLSSRVNVFPVTVCGKHCFISEGVVCLSSVSILGLLHLNPQLQNIKGKTTIFKNRHTNIKMSYCKQTNNKNSTKSPAEVHLSLCTGCWCVRAQSSGHSIDRCPPFLVVIYGCSSVEATVIWEMMAILI